MTEMLDVADRFGITPVVETFPFEQADDAIATVRDDTIRFRAVLSREKR